MRTLLVLLALSQLPAATFLNPVLPVAPDPAIVYGDGRYFATWTLGDRIVLRAAPTLAGLAKADEVIPAIAALFSRIGIPGSLKALGLGEDRIDWVADQSCGIERLIQNNPRPIDRIGMRRLVAAAYAGDRALVH